MSYEAHHWRALCAALDLPDLVAASFEERIDRRDEMNIRLANRFRELSADEVRKRYLPSPLRIDGQQLGESRGIPGIGRDTASVFSDLGLDEAELARLSAEGTLIW